MIVNNFETHIVSHMGWVDRNSILLYDMRKELSQKISLGNAKYLSIYSVGNDEFVAVHHYDSDYLELSIHKISNPDTVIDRLIFRSNNPIKFSQDTWYNCPKAYVAYAFGSFRLVYFNQEENKVELQSFPWFDDSYDHGYQGIIGATEIQDSDNIIISIQRDSEPVIYNPKTKQMISKIKLAGRHGNPRLYFRKKKNELWADDYDTLIRINPIDWGIIDKVQLQQGKEGTGLFIGNYAFNKDETICVVARPYSGDVVGINTINFKITHIAKVKKQPLDVALVKGKEVIARDWKTGDLLRTNLKFRFFA